MSAAPNLPLFRKPGELRQFPPPRSRWTRVAGWILAGILVIVLLLVVAAAVLLYNQSFHRYVLRVAEQKASVALNTQVEVRDFALSLSHMTLDLYGVVVHGATPYPNPPLLAAEHVGLGVGITSLLHRTWYVNDIRIDRPVVRVLVDRSGANNIPAQKSSGKSQTSVFDLGVRHALLEGGEVYYNNQKSILNADLHELTFKSAFDAAQKRYSGTLSYRDGHLQMGTYSPIPHAMEAQFEATPERFTLTQATLTSGQSQVGLKATVEDFSNPRVQANYTASLDAGEFRRILKNSTLPQGVISLSGGLKYQSVPNRPMLDVVKLDGDLSSRGLQVTTPSFRGEITGIGAHYSVANGNLEVQSMRAGLLGGELTGTASMRDISGTQPGASPQTRVRATLRGLSLSAAQRALKTKPAAGQQVALAGTLNADADAIWGKTLDNLVAHADATLQARVAQRAGNGKTAAVSANNSLPLNGVIHAQYAAANKQIGLTQSYLRTPQTSLMLDGTVSQRSSLQVRLQSNDLHELETAAAPFNAVPQPPAQKLDLHGTAAFVGALRGSTANPQLTGQLTAANLKLKGSSWRTLRTDVALTPSLASLQNGHLEPMDRGHINFSLSAGLRHWSFTNTSPLQANVDASKLNVAELARLAGSQMPVAGTLSANLALHGSELAPIGQGSVSLTQAKIAGEPIQSARLNFNGTGDEVKGNLEVKIPAGSAHSQFEYLPKQQGYAVQLEASGIRLEELQTLKDRNINVTGTLDLKASGRGTFNNPQVTATVSIPTLQIENQTMSGLRLQADVANHIANVALDSEAVSTSVRARARVDLVGDYNTIATLDTQSIPLQPLVAAYAPSQSANISGTTEIHATLSGPMKNKQALEAHLTIPVLQLKYKNVAQIGAASPIHVDYSNGVIALQRATIRGTDTDLEFQGSIPTNSAQPASLLLLGNVDLRLAQVFDPDIESSGQLKFHINSYGERANPDVHGQIEVVNANFATGTLPIGLQSGNGVLTLTKDRLQITSFRGSVGGGTVTAQGGISYKPSMQFDLALSGKDMRMLYPDGVREAVSTHLALTGSPQSALLSGSVRIDQLSFTPDFDLNAFLGQFSGDTVAPPAQGMAQNVQLAVNVESTNGLNLVSKTMSLQGTANLQVRGTAAEPVILGRVNLNGGDLLFNKDRYVLQGGTIDFTNPTETQPVVNVTANTTIQQYNIHLRFSGPTDHLQTSYSSDPALPPADIINLLFRGQTQEDAAANPQSGQQAVASGVTGYALNSQVRKIPGISALSIDPVLGGGGQNPGARVTIQQRVTGNLFVTFSTDVTSTQRQAIELQYKVSPRVGVTGTRDQNGGFGMQVQVRSR